MNSHEYILPTRLHLKPPKSFALALGEVRVGIFRNEPGEGAEDRGVGTPRPNHLPSIEIKRCPMHRTRNAISIVIGGFRKLAKRKVAAEMGTATGNCVELGLRGGGGEGEGEGGDYKDRGRDSREGDGGY